MLLSMTGFGEARALVGGVRVTAELRSVNNRHFKLSLRCPDAWSRFEPEIERLVRDRVTRGTVTLTLRQDRESDGPSLRINSRMLASYWQQLVGCAEELGAATPRDVVALATLPGVIETEDTTRLEPQEVWPDLRTLIAAAIEQFEEFRRQEGAAMEADLLGHGTVINGQVERISELAPQVASEYRNKLQQRIQEALAGTTAVVEPNDLLREVALFTDRSDISEEIVRLKSHLVQFQQLMTAEVSQGRKLDFLCQELFREANTIGSKANHIAISHAAVEVKTAIERMREVVQNVE